MQYCGESIFVELRNITMQSMHEFLKKLYICILEENFIADVCAGSRRYDSFAFLTEFLTEMEARPCISCETQKNKTRHFYAFFLYNTRTKYNLWFKLNFIEPQIAFIVSLTRSFTSHHVKTENIDISVVGFKLKLSLIYDTTKLIMKVYISSGLRQILTYVICLNTAHMKI